MNLRILLILVLLLSIFPSLVVAEYDFSLMVDGLNVSARSDHSRFNRDVAFEFGISTAKVERLVGTLGSAGDAYLSLKISKLSRRSVSDVVRIRQSSPGVGWGNVAKQMGIKPGSAEFMQLKQKPGKKQKTVGNGKNKNKSKKNKNK